MGGYRRLTYGVRITGECNGVLYFLIPAFGCTGSGPDVEAVCARARRMIEGNPNAVKNFDLDIEWSPRLA